MGYKRKTYTVKWPEESDLHGLEINLKGLSIGDLETVSNLRVEGATSISQIRPVLDIFTSSVISWNLEDENGDPVTWKPEWLPGAVGEDSDGRWETEAEAKARVIQGQDARMLISAVWAWVEVVSDIPAPLQSASPDGEPFPEESIPMETSSPNPSSLNTPN